MNGEGEKKRNKKEKKKAGIISGDFPPTDTPVLEASDQGETVAEVAAETTAPADSLLTPPKPLEEPAPRTEPPADQSALLPPQQQTDPVPSEPTVQPGDEETPEITQDPPTRLQTETEPSTQTDGPVIQEVEAVAPRSPSEPIPLADHTDELLALPTRIAPHVADYRNDKVTVLHYLDLQTQLLRSIERG